MKCRRSAIYATSYLIATYTACASLFANPTDAVVVRGEASIAQKAHALEIRASDKAVIHWKDFSIAKGEVTRFVQPSTSAAVLNRVVSHNPSQLLGKLEANGKVYLINQNGILVGEGAVINTASFIASALDIDDAHFLKGGDLLFHGGSKAAVVNLGTIEVWDGDVVLIGHVVENQGKISAPNGMTALAAAEEVLLKPSGEKRVFIRPPSQFQKESGGFLALEAELKSEGNPYALAICHKGAIDAMHVVEQKGRIILTAADGKLEVSGNNAVASDLFLQSSKNLLIDAKSKIQLSGNSSLSGESGSIDVRGSIEGGSGGIHFIAKDAAGHLAIGQSGLKVPVSIKTLSGPIGLSSAGSITIRGGGTGGSCTISSHKGHVKIDAATDLILMGGSSASKTPLLLQSDEGGLFFTAGRDLSITAGLFNDSFAKAVTNTAPIDFKVGRNFLLNGGGSYSTSGNSYAFIATHSGDVAIGTYAKPVGGTVTITGGTSNSMGAKGAFAKIVSEKGTIHIHSRGDLTIKGGDEVQNPNSDKPAEIKTHLGDIWISSLGNLTLSGGSASKSSAQIRSNEGSVHFANVGSKLQLQGGSNPECFARIKGKDVYIDHVQENVVLLGAMGDGSFAEIESNGIVRLSTMGDLVLKGSSYHNNAHAKIAGLTLELMAKGDLQMTAQSAPVTLSTLNGHTSIDITGNVQMKGGSRPSSDAKIHSGGDLEMHVGQTLSMSTGHLSGSGNAKILSGGNAEVTSGQDIILSGGDSLLNYPPIVSISSYGGDLTISSHEAISLSDNAELFLMGRGSFNALAGTDILLFGSHEDPARNPRIFHGGTGELNLVVDNQFPDYPGVGMGALIMNPRTRVYTNGGPLRIFSTEQPFNTIEGTLNGVLYTPGQEFLNTAIERWGIYYSSSYHSQPFTIFYKSYIVPEYTIGHFHLAAFEYLQNFHDYILFSKDISYYKFFHQRITMPKYLTQAAPIKAREPKPL